jgi:uncharacterized membrane protein YidH (DUF202 family)
VVFVSLGVLLIAVAAVGFAAFVHMAVVESVNETYLDWALRFAFSVLVALVGWKAIRYGIAGRQRTSAAKPSKDSDQWRREAVVFGSVVLVVLAAVLIDFITGGN